MDSSILPILIPGGALGLLLVILLAILAGKAIAQWWLGTAAIQKELAASRAELAAIRALLEKAAY